MIEISLFSGHYLIVLIAAVIHFVIGMLWYSPLIFGKAWAKAVGFKKTDMEVEKNKRKWKPYLASFLTSIVMVYILGVFIQMAQVTTVLGGMYIAFLVWLGFVATATMGGMLWEKKPLELYFINAAYHLIALNIAAAFIGAML